MGCADRTRSNSSFIIHCSLLIINYSLFIILETPTHRSPLHPVPPHRGLPPVARTLQNTLLPARRHTVGLANAFIRAPHSRLHRRSGSGALQPCPAARCAFGGPTGPPAAHRAGGFGQNRTPFALPRAALPPHGFPARCSCPAVEAFARCTGQLPVRARCPRLERQGQGPEAAQPVHPQRHPAPRGTPLRRSLATRPTCSTPPTWD